MLVSHPMPALPAKAKMSRVLATFSSFSELEDKERREWQAMTPVARLRAVETMRQLNHSGYDTATSRLQRLYTVA